MTQLGNKTAVVTGAASGIGAALARGLAERGAHLALVDVDAAGLEQLSAELARPQRRVSRHLADVSDRERMRALPAEVIAEHGGVELLVNNAGVTLGSMFADHSLEDAEWLLDINVRGVLYGCKFFLPELLKAPRAHIVNVSSMFGLFPMPGQAVYSASKAAVRGFTEALWTELDGTSVRLTTVHPGGIQTNVIRAARAMSDEDRASAMAQLDRFGTSAEKAAAKILRAVENDRLRVLIGPEAYAGELLKRLFPVGFQRMLTLAFRRQKRTGR